MCTMPDDRLPKKLLLGQAKGRCPPGCPRSSSSDVAVRDCQNLVRHELESLVIVVIIIIIVTISVGVYEGSHK